MHYNRYGRVVEGLWKGWMGIWKGFGRVVEGLING